MSEAEQQRLERRRCDLAGLHFLISRAIRGRFASYQEFADEVGGIARGQGPRLTRIGKVCISADLPILSVLVVRGETRMPSPGAGMYAALGLSSRDDFGAETERCFQHDWSRVNLSNLEFP